jgi:hypothetical protein
LEFIVRVQVVEDPEQSPPQEEKSYLFPATSVAVNVTLDPRVNVDEHPVPVESQLVIPAGLELTVFPPAVTELTKIV